MSDKSLILERLGARPKTSELDADDDVLDFTQEKIALLLQKSFTLARGVRQFVPMVEFNSADGNSISLGYSYLVIVAFNPSEGVLLEFTTHKVSLRGRCLRPLYTGLRRHLAARIFEFSGANSLAVGDGISCVTEITVKVHW